MQDKSNDTLLTERAIYISCMALAEEEEEGKLYKLWWQKVKDIDIELHRRYLEVRNK